MKALNSEIDGILSTDKDFIFYFLGHQGLEFYNFLSKINSQHIALKDAINEDFKLFYEILELCKYTHENKLESAKNFIIDNIKKYNFNIKKLPQKSQRFARFRKDKDEIRLSKKKWKFSSQIFIDNLIKIWNETPNDTDLFKKNNSKFIEEKINFGRIHSRFTEIKCFEAAACIKKSIELLEYESYYGYRKLSIIQTACVLAKINKIGKPNKNYQPCVYPFFELEKIASDYVKREIKEAENNDDSYFDSYLVVVPSFIDHNTEQDIETLVNKKLNSIVLGEKDESCYFICLW